MMKKEEAVAAKKAEIEKYEAMLDRYGRGRWYWSYRRTLDDLVAQLKALEQQED